MVVLGKIIPGRITISTPFKNIPKGWCTKSKTLKLFYVFKPIAAFGINDSTDHVLYVHRFPVMYDPFSPVATNCKDNLYEHFKNMFELKYKVANDKE